MEIYTVPVGAMRVNCYILKDATGVGAIVDPGGETPQNGSDRILDAVKEHSVDVKMIILTHAHFDHMLSLERVRAALNVPLALGKEDAPALADPYISYMAQYAGKLMPIKPAERLLSDGDVIKLGNSELRVMHTPGHTPGSVCLIGDGFILTGDTLFCGSAGRCDLNGGDQFALLRSLKRLRELSGNYTLYPGHGGSTDLQRERTNNPYLQD